MTGARWLSRHDLHALAGAAFDDIGGWELPAHYGADEQESVAAEYLAATADAAVCDLGERSLLRVTGPQRQKFLHALLSNDVQGLAAGHGCPAALMDVKGRQIAFLRVLVAADAVRLEMPADRLALVEETLVHYRVAAPVRFAVEPTAVLAVLGPRAEALLQGLGVDATTLVEPDRHAEATLAGHEVRVVRAGDLPRRGLLLHASEEAGPAAWQALVAAGARPLGRRALDALRIEEGRPWYGVDVTEENLLHETGLVREYHSASKGCYVGQEVVARLEGRGGHVNRALRGLRLSAPARPGDVLGAEGKEVGRITTASVSPTQGPIAMGYVHRSRFEPGSAVDVAGHPATVAALPLVATA